MDNSKPGVTAVIRFTDNVEIPVEGALRILDQPDGLYIAGKGFLIPVRDEQDARQVIAKLSH